MPIDHDPFPDAHPCERYLCKAIVAYDDEPFCYNHSPNEGSFVKGYSYKKRLAENNKRCPNCERWEAEKEGSEVADKPCLSCQQVTP